MLSPLLHSITLLLPLLIRTSTAQGFSDPNCSECQPVHRLLSKCHLPPLATPEDTLDGSGIPTFRNATHAPSTGIKYTVDGPSTFVLANSSQASCFCTEGRLSLWDCDSCVSGAQEGEVGFIESSTTLLYVQECSNWGYFRTPRQSYPASTRIAQPTATTPPQSKASGCEVCDIITAQIKQCNLPPLDTNPPNESKVINEQPDIYARYSIFSRRDGDCMCTLPVLRRLGACGTCVRNNLRQSYEGMVNGYQDDCAAMGYYSDEKRVLPQESSTLVPSATSTGGAGGASATPGAGVRITMDSSVISIWALLGIASVALI